MTSSSVQFLLRRDGGDTTGVIGQGVLDSEFPLIMECREPCDPLLRDRAKEWLDGDSGY